MKFYFAVPENIKAISRNYFIMKTSNTQELQHIAINNSSDIAFKDFMKLHKKCTAKPYSFLGNDTTLRSDNQLHFRYNLLERTWKSDHKADDKIRDEKLRYNINREAARLLDAIIRYRCL